MRFGAPSQLWLLLVVPIAVLGGHASLPLFMLAAFVQGSATAFFQPAAIGLVPDAISGPRLQQANAMLNLSQSTAQLFGPVLSGILVATIGAGWVFAIRAASSSRALSRSTAWP